MHGFFVERFRENVPQLHYIQDIPQYVASVSAIVNHTKTAARARKQGNSLTDFLLQDSQCASELGGESISDGGPYF